MQLAFILKTRAAYSANLPGMTSIDRMERNFGYYYYPEFADTSKYILKVYLYVLLQNNIVIKKEVNENARKAAKST